MRFLEINPKGNNMTMVSFLPSISMEINQLMGLMKITMNRDLQTTINITQINPIQGAINKMHHRFLLCLREVSLWSYFGVLIFTWPSKYLPFF